MTICKNYLKDKKYKLRLNPSKCTFGVRSGKLLGFIINGKGIKVDPAKVKAIQEMPVLRIEKEVRILRTTKLHLQIHFSPNR